VSIVRFGLWTGLLIVAAVVASDVVDLALPSAVDLSRSGTTSLHPATAVLLDDLESPISFTFVVTRREEMPSSHKGVEAGVVEVLDRIVAYAPERIAYEVVDPSEDERLAAWASARRASPSHLEQIVGDRDREATAWCSLVISMGRLRDAHIQAIGPGHLASLEALIAGRLRGMASPPRPTIAIAGRASAEFRDAAARAATVVRFDPASGEDLPPDVDLLIWLDPSRAGPGATRLLHRILSRGKNVVLAGSIYSVLDVEGPKGPRFQFKRTASGMSDLLGPFGLAPVERLLFDEEGPLRTGAGGPPVRLPFEIRTLPANMDTRNFSRMVTVSLGLHAVTALRIHEREAQRAGFRPRIVFTSSDRSWTLPLEDVELTLSDLQAVIYEAKRPLAVLLEPDDPLSGRLLVLGSSSLFSSPQSTRAPAAHTFWRMLFQTFASGDALAISRLRRSRPDGTPNLSSGAEGGWRGSMVLLLPLAVLLGYGLNRRTWSPAPLDGRRLLLVATVAGLGLAVLHAVGRFDGPRLDATADRVNSLGTRTERTLETLDEPVRIDLIASPAWRLPPDVKRARAEVEDLIRELVRRSRGRLRFSELRPNELPPEELRSLSRRGLLPLTSIDGPSGDAAYCGLRLARGDRSVVISPLDPEQLSRLEFRVVAALEMLERGRPRRVGVVSDRPRLSPAEAFEDFQKKQLTAPSGADVYSEAKRLLAGHGFEVVEIDPRSPVVPTDLDLLVWLQPHRPRTKMAAEFAAHLHRGSPAVLALQHFNIQQRQYSGRSFRTVWWPQPQYPDMEDFFALVGVEQVREVLMDEVQADLVLETQLNRAAVREHPLQTVARPFLIRALPAGFGRSAVTAGLGDLLFIWGNRFAVDEVALAGLGLSATTLVSTSSRAWSYVWSGGFLQDPVFESGDLLPGPQPLVLQLEGGFPPAELATPAPPVQEEGAPPRMGGRRPILMRSEGPGGPSTRLVLVGSSELFKNRHLGLEGFQHRRLLVNLAVDLTLGPAAVALLDRVPPLRGFEPPRAERVLQARVLVIGSPVVVVALLTLFWGILRRRPLRVGGGRV
jgi:hypothetical protein